MKKHDELPATYKKPELKAHLARASAFALPSVPEPEGGMDNLPTVIMEAMATGLPVVSTRIGGIPEMVIDNETGVLVEAHDVVGLAGAIEKVTNDRSLGERLGHAGYGRAQRLFSIEKNVRELYKLICSGAL